MRQSGEYFIIDQLTQSQLERAAKTYRTTLVQQITIGNLNGYATEQDLRILRPLAMRANIELPSIHKLNDR